MEDKDKQNELEDENFDIILWDHDDNEDKKGFNVWKKQLKIMLKKNITLQGPIDLEGNCINLLFTNCIDDAKCDRDIEVDKILEYYVIKNNERMDLNWETDSSKWEDWDESKLDYKVTKKLDVIHVPNSNFMYNFALTHQNYTHFGLLFDIKKDGDVTNYRYQVWYNSTLNKNGTDTFGSRVISVARGIDEAIATYANGDPNIKATFDIDLKDFPTISEGNIGETAISMLGSVFFFCSAMVIFINSLNTIVSEKDNKIRFCMEMMGLYKSVYWLSWFIIFFVLIFVNTIATILFGMLFQYSFFLNTNFFVIFSLLVFFNFGRIYFDISSISGSSVNVITGTIVKGKGFGISDLSKVPETYINYVLDLKYFNSPGTCLIYMLLDILLYVVLTLYFDNVIPNEFGNRQPFYYFLLPSYWGISKSDSNSPNEWVKNTLDKYPPTYDKNKIDSDVLDHINYTCDSNNNDPIKVINLMKKYGRGKDEKVVVNGSYLSFSKDKVQNGAGKSTTINIMAGLTPPNGGDVSVFGKNLKNDLNGVQRELGISMEHLLLYTGLKGVTTSNLDKILEQRLKAVKLWTVKDARTNTYSGGMKRRLSMIIATIGDPSVVLLDEPTTGMDPLNRRHVWRFIEKFKKNRCIVVTTHSMEEADALGDEIIIMANGDIKAIGNGVHLKNKFGAGYRISMIAKDKKINEIKEKVQEYVPGAKMEDDSAGALIYNFTKEQLQYIPKFIKYLDENPDNLISNWGISQTTLEEVFLLVIQETSNRKIKDE
ncbi:P-loop containing nucleoside triphosphate hydrolase protein [Neocallimastix californiae]|uniref:p-loop containing nucleoside triphosphate hydrolase protein n=1 Tax=Neocallimastix californiae TaxID=1754190 RepID=A0A1Y2B0T7_9FUNG|nr:P-loop containing nucleoside triphosphate hydrolase protein [Neocallimastix californiae]|eukprot:ORY28097.1 P-loop containing nucleoside triphosphate hydrolase protein [Neocallimastix californiae]